MKVTSPFASRIPTDMKGNLSWRRSAMKRVLKDPDAAEYYLEACRRDPIFFLNGFGWTYDPRLSNPYVPFILYPFQRDGVLSILEAINNHDLLIEKSRDMGASWICIGSCGWCWRFMPGFSGLFVSRVEEYVDKPGNPKAMFWKLDCLLDHMPSWLLPIGYDDSCRSKLHILNPETGGVIDGESTTGNVARGDRRTVILLDEFAAVIDGHRVLSSTRDATNCRLFNSTPAGTNTAFFDMRQTGIARLRLHWSSHPVKARGLYTTDQDGKLKIINPEGYPDGYEPILDGKLRSPWYDKECTRTGSPQEIAQELDIDYLGSGFQYFNPAAINEMIRQHSRPPMLIGDLEYDDTTGDPLRFTEYAAGSLRLWCLLDGKGQPPIEHKYSSGIDVSAGTGASNSCIAGYDRTTNAKIFEYANSHVRPEQFAKQAVAIARFFGNAYMVWESGGPGRQFGSRVMELGYGNIHYRLTKEGISGRMSDMPGIVTTKEIKLQILGEYRAAVEKGELINYSRDAMNETLEYIFAPDGGIEHSKSCGKVDPSGARANHGDRVIADALAWHGMRAMGSSIVKETKEIQVGSLAWRNKMREEQRAHEDTNDGWKP